MGKLTKKDRIKVLEWQVKTLIKSMTNIEEWSSFADNMPTELNHALPDPEYDAKCEAQEADIDASLDRHHERLGLNNPKLKQLDQSVFDGAPNAPNDKRFFAIDEDGQGWFYRDKPSINVDDKRWMEPNYSPIRAGFGYDATNWQDSLIERKELTGSDLCRAMLERGDKYVMCILCDDSEPVSAQDAFASAVSAMENGFFYDSTDNLWRYAVPINNQGEPLTASEVGLQLNKE